MSYRLFSHTTPRSCVHRVAGNTVPAVSGTVCPGGDDPIGASMVFAHLAVRDLATRGWSGAGFGFVVRLGLGFRLFLRAGNFGDEFVTLPERFDQRTDDRDHRHRHERADRTEQ